MNSLNMCMTFIRCSDTEHFLWRTHWIQNIMSFPLGTDEILRFTAIKSVVQLCHFGSAPILQSIQCSLLLPPPPLLPPFSLSVKKSSPTHIELPLWLYWLCSHLRCKHLTLPHLRIDLLFCQPSVSGYAERPLWDDVRVKKCVLPMLLINNNLIMIDVNSNECKHLDNLVDGR